jgi:hypothetical protein
MLRTNLATRPFYNVRAVQLALGLFAALVVAITLFNVVQIVRLSASQQSLGARAAQAEDEAAKLLAEAAKARAQINPQELEVVADAAREANAIIDRRAFSWTELFAKFEATLPPDVRITAIRPRLERGTFVVAVRVEARRAEDLDGFMEALETKGGFRDVLDIQEQTGDEGLLQAIIEGVYVPPARAAGAEPQGASR